MQGTHYHFDTAWELQQGSKPTSGRAGFLLAHKTQQRHACCNNCNITSSCGINPTHAT
jgi:hypothetical protein